VSLRGSPRDRISDSINVVTCKSKTSPGKKLKELEMHGKA